MASGPTYEPIATATPTGASGTFTSIPQTYTDLIIMVNARSASTSDIFAMQMNGNASGYSGTYLEGSGGGVTSGRGTSEISFRGGYIPGSSYPNDWSSDIYHIMNYAGATYKTCLSNARFQSTSTTGFALQLKIGSWQNTAAITSIVYGTANGSNFASGTTITLYGIKAA